MAADWLREWERLLLTGLGGEAGPKRGAALARADYTLDFQGGAFTFADRHYPT